MPSTGKRLFQLSDSPFKSIALCTPLNVLVKTGDKRSVFVDSGDDSVPVDARVSEGGELVISTTGSFESSKAPIQVVVTVPKGELEGVSISPSGGAVVVDGVEPKTKTFNASSVLGAADLILQNVSADEVFLSSSGGSRIFLLNKGFPDARVRVAHLAAGGTSSGFLLGADNADLLLEGAADVAVDPRPGGNVTGVALGANSVFATANTSICNVAGPVFGQACVPVRGALASKLTPPVFTCGIAAIGPFTCPVPGAKAAGKSEGSAERMGAQAPSPSMAEGTGAAAAPAPAEIATGGKRRRGLLQQKQQQVPVLAWNGSLAFMRRCDAKLDDLLMSKAKVEESA